MATLKPQTETTALSDYLHLVIRGRRWLIVGAVIGAVAGAIWYVTTPATFSSTVTVALQRIPSHIPYGPEEKAARPVTIDTDAALLKSDAVLSAVAPVLEVPPDEVPRHLTVTAAPLSDALNLTVTTSSADQAEDGAKVAAEALLRQRVKYFVSGQQGQVGYLQGRVTRLRQVLSSARNEPLRINEVASIRSALDILSPRLALARRLSSRAGVILSDQGGAEARRPLPVYVPVISGTMFGLLSGLAWVRMRERVK